ASQAADQAVAHAAAAVALIRLGSFQHPMQTEPPPAPGFFLSLGGGAPPVPTWEGSLLAAFTYAAPDLPWIEFSALVFTLAPVLPLADPLLWKFLLAFDPPDPDPDPAGVTWRMIVLGKLFLSFLAAA